MPNPKGSPLLGELDLNINPLLLAEVTYIQEKPIQLLLQLDRCSTFHLYRIMKNSMLIKLTKMISRVATK